MKPKTSLAVMALCALMPAGALALTQNPGGQGTEPDAAAIEAGLFRLLMVERASNGLPTLTLSEALSEAARAHSRDMSDRRFLSHISSDGRTLPDRLSSAGIYFKQCGENVAHSETPAAEVIHRELMASPSHREQILDPRADTVGLGVVEGPEGGYHITQDFMEALLPVPAEAAEIKIRARIDKARDERSLPALSFQDELIPLAREFARHKVERTPSPIIPEKFGRTIVNIVASPSLDSQGIIAGPLLEKGHRGAGLGVHFGRDGEHPGGAYFIVFIILPQNAFLDLGAGELRGLVLLAANDLRRAKGLEELVLNVHQSRQARSAVLALRSSRGVPGRSGGQPLPAMTAYLYVTEDPRALPPGLEKPLFNRLLKHFGAYLEFAVTADYPMGIFFAAIVL